MAFEISIQREFSASHQLRLYDGSLEPLHGHNWIVIITVGADKLDSIGVVMDFHELERQVDRIVGPMHNRHLNDLPAFKTLNPSAENVAVCIAEALEFASPVRLIQLELQEATNCRARWVNRG
jgi:6-pyruvoyltetrahydropterin/6-carboxytetrahydropterin synthase